MFMFNGLYYSIVQETIRPIPITFKDRTKIKIDFMFLIGKYRNFALFSCSII